MNIRDIAPEKMRAGPGQKEQEAQEFAWLATQGRAGGLRHGEKGPAKVSLEDLRRGDRCPGTVAPCYQYFRAELALNQCHP